jgi:hypothetical protein
LWEDIIYNMRMRKQGPATRSKSRASEKNIVTPCRISRLNVDLRYEPEGTGAGSSLELTSQDLSVK